MIDVVNAHQRFRTTSQCGGFYKHDFSPLLTEEEVKEIRESSKTTSQLAKKFNRSNKVIRNVIKRKTYTHVS